MSGENRSVLNFSRNSAMMKKMAELMAHSVSEEIERGNSIHRAMNILMGKENEYRLNKTIISLTIAGLFRTQ